MPKIKNWKKVYKGTWRHRKTGDEVVIRSYSGKYKVTTGEYNDIWDRFVEISAVEFTNRDKARKEAVEYMKAHPRGHN